MYAMHTHPCIHTYTFCIHKIMAGVEKIRLLGSISAHISLINSLIFLNINRGGGLSVVLVLVFCGAGDWRGVYMAGRVWFGVW